MAITENLQSIKAYPDPNYPQLKQALANWHQLSPAQILPGNGSAELLTWAAMELSNLNYTYLLTPAFSDYQRSLSAFGATIKTSPLNLSTGVWEIPRGVKKSGGLIINNPHNPTGKLLTREKISSYLEEFALVIVDEAFMDFLPPSQQESVIDLVSTYPNLVVLRSLTKFYSLPGLRLGYAIAHPSRLEKWQQWRDPWPVNSLAIAAATTAIQDTQFQQQTWQWLFQTRQELFNSINATETFQCLPSSANFLLVKTTIPGSQLQQQLLQKYQIFIRDCLSFPELGEKYFRLAILSSGDNHRLVEALKAEETYGSRV